MEAKLAVIYQQAPDSQSQALRFDLIQATWMSESYAVQTFYILTFFFTPKRGLVSSFRSSHDFPVCHTRVPAPTISSHDMPSQCASSIQVPHVCCPAPLLSRDFFTPPEVVGGSFPHWRHVSAIYTISMLFPALWVPLLFPSCVFFSFFYFPFSSSSSCPVSIF